MCDTAKSGQASSDIVTYKAYKPQPRYDVQEKRENPIYKLTRHPMSFLNPEAFNYMSEYNVHNIETIVHTVEEHAKMPHLLRRASDAQAAKRDPESTQAYLVGGGIASLAAAVHLVQDAKVPAKNIHILESLPVPGGSMDGAGNAEDGYVLRGGRMLNFSYLCLYDLLEKVPSLSNPEKTLMQEIKEFNADPKNRTLAKARLIETTEAGPKIIDCNHMGLSPFDRYDLVRLTMETEKSLGKKRIDECFHPEFFKTKFWFMWATTFAFQQWHSAVEFRRYLHRFIHEFPRINTLAGVDRTPYNQYDSIIRPLVKYLKEAGVDFRYNCKVTDIDLIEGIPITASELHMVQDGAPMTAQLDPQDIVMVTIGSMTSGSSIGTNKEAPSSVVDDEKEDGTWDLWGKLASKDPKFGRPAPFASRIQESEWESFTVTLKDQEFITKLVELTNNEPGTGALMTFKDSPWLMSIVVPHQPHMLEQAEGVTVFWGYGLFPDKEGTFVKKPMKECSGEEIMIELLGYLGFPMEPILSQSATRPCLMPYITSQFLTREPGDRPAVIPEGSTNLALLGQFVEIPEDTVFTVEYSVRAAQMAVFELMGVDKKPKGIFKGEHHIGILAETMRKLLF
jgi:oleate hydratase